MNIRNLGLTESLGAKFKDVICAELCLKLWFEWNWYFYNITEPWWFLKRLPRNKVLNNYFLKSVWKSNWSEVHCGTLDCYSNQMIRYQFPCTRFDQISNHKHDIYLYGKLSNRLLAQAANKNTKFMFTKTGWLLFFKYGFRSDCPEKF